MNILPDSDRAARRVQWMRFGLSTFGIALFAVTVKLWTGQTDFPQVPLLSIGHLLPRNVDAIGLVGILICLALAAVTTNLVRPTQQANGVARWALALFCVLFGVLVIANQHRLQPWAYLLWLTAMVLWLCRAEQAIFLLRLLVISVYLHSAISKADYEFLATLGQTFLKSVGISLNPGYESLSAAAVFPLAELLIGVGLFFPRWRRWAVVAAVVMHLVLMAILSPLRLKHEPAVVIWNAYFVWQVVVLFGWSATKDAAVSLSAVTEKGERHSLHSRRGQSSSEILATAVIGAVVVLPLLEPFGGFDHWPSWGLYAPRNSRCKLYIDEDAVDKLPNSWGQGLTLNFDSQHGWTPGLEIPLARNSLRLLDVPIYPQDRFQLGVAIAIARRYGIGNQVHVVWESSSNRMSGRRKRETIHGLKELEAAAERYWLNVEPRGDLSVAEDSAG